MEPEGSLPYSQQPPSRACAMFRNNPCAYSEELLAPRPNTRSRRPLLFGCPQLLIQYVSSPSLYLDAEDAPGGGDKEQHNTVLSYLQVTPTNP